MPVELLLTADDDTTKLVKLPVEIWYGGDRYVYRVATGETRRRAHGSIPMGRSPTSTRRMTPGGHRQRPRIDRRPPSFGTFMHSSLGASCT